VNSNEEKLVEILADLKENYGVFGIKAEFEAEGTRLEECVRLKEIISSAGLNLTLKIGGCEAIRDMYDSRIIGVHKIVAPMIESSFALKKFVESFFKVFAQDEREHIKFAINIETQTSYKFIDDILDSESASLIDAIVVGRNDMSYSMGLTRNGTDSDEVMRVSTEIVKKAKAKGLICGIGGGVSAISIPLFEKNMSGFLDYYETRKVMFDFSKALTTDYETGILKALNFEILWLKIKRDFYKTIYEEDLQRIEVLESRYKESMIERGI